ncbi:unnamed protein product [Acanthoscelides obtectus]|uniref:Uncharacterized protein n=1 Tax=Acanthoscelides obtectus TaxID=200917 RepID=A0A9P0KHC9_ACAOB|nr:unnamed protein product [Acanthoscelides obtectus]CAK1651934.1 hypothetical protein AOBTE_LOCUS17556 [Acanthoscelides obtectus]
MTEKAFISKFRCNTKQMENQPKRTVIIPKGLLNPEGETAINIPKNLTPDVPFFMVPAKKGITARVLPSFGDELSTTYYKKASKGTWTNTEAGRKRRIMVLKNALDPDRDNVIYIPKNTNPNALLLVGPPKLPGGPLVAQVLPDFRDRLSSGVIPRDLTAIPQKCHFDYKKKTQKETEPGEKLAKSVASGNAVLEDGQGEEGEEMPQEERHPASIEYYEDDIYAHNYDSTQSDCPVIQAAMHRVYDQSGHPQSQQQEYQYYTQGPGYQHYEQGFNSTTSCRLRQAQKQKQYYEETGEEQDGSEEDDEEDEDEDAGGYYECCAEQDYDNRICSGVPAPGEPRFYY